MKKRNIVRFAATLFSMMMGIPSLGMVQGKNNVEIFELDEEALIKKDIIVYCALSDKTGKIKNLFNQTCKYFNRFIRKKNTEFIGLPEFDAHPKDINEILLFLIWHDSHPEIIAAIKEKTMVDKITFPFGCDKALGWGVGPYECSWPHEFGVDCPREYKKKYVRNNEKSVIKCDNFGYKLPSEEEQALVFAALCKDVSAVEVLAEKIKIMVKDINLDSYPVAKMDLHEGLLGGFIVHDDIKAFELVVRNDPYGALNLFVKGHREPACAKAFLDFLMEKGRDRANINKYVEVYRACGGLTTKELELKIVS